MEEKENLLNLALASIPHPQPPPVKTCPKCNVNKARNLFRNSGQNKKCIAYIDEKKELQQLLEEKVPMICIIVGAARRFSSPIRSNPVPSSQSREGNQLASGVVKGPKRKKIKRRQKRINRFQMVWVIVGSVERITQRKSSSWWIQE